MDGIEMTIMKTIEQWVKDEKERLDRFADSYLNGATQNPDMFPTILPEGEWDEQYRCYDE